VDGILGHNLLLSQAFWWESLHGRDLSFHGAFLLFTIKLWPSGGLFHKLFFFHDGILAIKEPFARTLPFFTMGLWLSGSLSHELFFTMEFWLSRSLSHELFFFHDGILAIKEPFTRTFLFSRWNSGYQGAFHTNFFHDGILEIHNLGEDSFYIYITKSIYIGSASLKTLLLDLEPPLQGKEYGLPYSNATKRVKATLHLSRTCFFSRSHL
jgi:hypothetical protein